MNGLILAVAGVSFLLPYIILYKNDPFALFRKTKRADWNSVFMALGISARVKSGKSYAWVSAVAGFVLYAVALFTNMIILAVAGSFALLAYVVYTKPIPFPRREIALPYPRHGRATFEAPAVKGKPSGPFVDVSKIRLFYVSYRNGIPFSLPEGKVPIPDLLVSFLEQGKPEFAWIQIIYKRAHAHKYLEVQRWRLIYEKQMLSYRQADPAWVSHIDVLIKKIEQMLASDLFAVAIRGVLMGADPMSIALGYADEVDSLAVFETRDPGLLYEMATKKLNAYIPRQRAEPPFFFTNKLALIATPPSSAKSVPVAPLGLQILQGFGEEERMVSDTLELNPIPTIDEKFHFFPEGVLELVYDGKLHVLAGGLQGKALSTIGTSTVTYEPLEALKQKLQVVTLPEVQARRV